MNVFKIIITIIKFLEIYSSKYFFSVVKREKKSKYIHSNPDVNELQKKVAIVMQGPVILKENFTYQTLCIYKKRYPNTKLILSTWEDTDSKVISKFKNINVEVVLNKKPNYFGISNINLQVKTSINGIKKAKEDGNEYCLKTRTDQRVYKHDFLQFLLSILSLYKINHNILKNRLITCSLNTFKYRLYGVTDMFMFGEIDDMILYWNAKYDMRKIDEVNTGTSSLDFSKKRLCEVYLCTEFLKKIKYKTDYTLKNYWQMLSQYFYVVDAMSLDLFWFKYIYWNERKRYQNQNRKLDEEFYFSDWINCRNNMVLYSKNQEKKLLKKNMS